MLIINASNRNKILPHAHIGHVKVGSEKLPSEIVTEAGKDFLS